ncbi:uncharacterized protein EV420DRAFT_1483759 [Desarmillaria tabescens]|uniref:Uncharacterized protein n=1 Tax=Armillaria tabescens TaxID=1929756 RepID=A0AA39JT32_ARMTA|nr:uncharacterized protein EV420DRAFT_1483759 [Desarmillaria tabescens]KAK0447390.1 hypothetical protein EV420DRAFT_1483759 [Desarmillaria tabescens]
MSIHDQATISMSEFAELTDDAIISDYVAAHDIPSTVALPRSALGSYDLPAIMQWLFPAESNPVPLALLANHAWVAQPDGTWKLERHFAAEEFLATPDDEINGSVIPTLNHYPPDGLPVSSSVDLLDGARKLEDGRLEVHDALRALQVSIKDATLLYTKARLALDEERAKTTSLMALVTSICGQAFADKIVRTVEVMDTGDFEEEEDGGESSDDQRNSNFTQKKLQPSPRRAGVNKALFGDPDWASKMKGASDALREDTHTVLMPPPKTTNHAGQSGAFLISRSIATSPRKRSRSSEGEDASTSPKRIKTGVEEGSRVQTQLAKSSSAAVFRGQKTTLESKSIEERSPVDLDNSGSSDEQALNPVPPQQVSGSSDPEIEDSDSDSASATSSSDSDSPLISWSSVVGAISNGIFAAMAWYTNPPVTPLAEESISARRPILLRTATPPSTIYRPRQPSVSPPGQLRRTKSFFTYRSKKTGRMLRSFGTGKPGNPHVVESDDLLDMDSFYEKAPPLYANQMLGEEDGAKMRVMSTFSIVI